jgi:hypothetical protein
MEKIDTAIDTIIKLKAQREFEQNCFVRALRSIPEKYQKIFFTEYLKLLGANDGLNK